MTETRHDPAAGFPPGLRAWSGYPEEEGPIGPPVQAIADFAIIGLRFRPGWVQAHLPPPLVPVPGDLGTAYVFISDKPGMMSPFGYSFVGIEVEGFDSPDGSHAQYVVEGFISPRGARLIVDVLNGNVGRGWARHDHGDGIVTGTAGPPGGEAIRLSMRPTPAARVDTHGSHNFLGPDPGGRGMNVYPVAFTGNIHMAEPLSVEMLPAAGPALQAMHPEALLWGLWGPALSITYGAPRLIHETAALAAETARTLLLETFARLGRPAAIVGEDGVILHLNRQAEEAGAFAGGQRLRLARAADQARLARRLAEALGAEAGLDLAPLAAEGPDGRPLLLQVMPLKGFRATGAAALVLFTDPAAPPGPGPSRSLQLLGLTPAEARIAALVGTGQSPREAAEALGLTIATVRSALKLVYDKLGIARQSQLAAIVARLA